MTSEEHCGGFRLRTIQRGEIVGSCVVVTVSHKKEKETKSNFPQPPFLCLCTRRVCLLLWFSLRAPRIRLKERAPSVSRAYFLLTMSSTHVNKYVSDIPLKRPSETFIDDPTSLAETSLDELEFDFTHNIKDINRLHVFHAIAILNGVLEDLINLSENPDLLNQLHEQQLRAHNIDIHALAEDIDDQVDGSHAETATLPQDALAVDLSDVDSSIAAPESYVSLSEAAKIGIDGAALGVTLLPNSNESMEDELDESNMEEILDNANTSGSRLEGEFISTESLVQSTSLDIVINPITAHSTERMESEVNFHRNPKVQQQSEHLLKVFGLAKPPGVSIAEYLLRIQKYAPSVSISVYIHSAYLLYKLCVLLKAIPLTRLNVYRLIAALIRCLTKKLEDVHQRQKLFAQVVGVEPRELCKLEVSFLYLCNFKLVVSEYILNHFLTNDFIALRHFCKNHFPAAATGDASLK